MRFNKSSLIPLKEASSSFIREREKGSRGMRGRESGMDPWKGVVTDMASESNRYRQQILKLLLQRRYHYSHGHEMRY